MTDAMVTLMTQFGGFGVMAVFFGFILRWLTVQITKDIRLLSHTIKNQAGMIIMLTRMLVIHDAQVRGVLAALDVNQSSDAAQAATRAYNDLKAALDGVIAEMQQRASRRNEEFKSKVWGFE